MQTKTSCELLGAYPAGGDEGALLVEMRIGDAPKNVDLSLFYLKDDALKESDRQVPWDERFLSEDGTRVIGDAFDQGSLEGDGTRVAFFLFPDGPDAILSTPYGEFRLNAAGEIPRRLKGIVEFSPVD